jgi:hypothetical protein
MTKESFKTFEDLDCWKACTEVRRFVSELVKKYPKEERFALVDDMKRAVWVAIHKLISHKGGFNHERSSDGLQRKSIETVRGSLEGED